MKETPKIGMSQLQRMYVDKCKFPKDGSPPKSVRYIGSMVADVNRNYFMVVFFSTLLTRKAQMESYGVLRCSSELLYGGICNSVLYLYEVFPMTYLVEQAGGQAFTG